MNRIAQTIQFSAASKHSRCAKLTGPANLLVPRRNPVATSLARVTGTWAGDTALAVQAHPEDAHARSSIDLVRIVVGMPVEARWSISTSRQPHRR